MPGFKHPKSESARNYTLNLQIVWVEQKCIFGHQMCSHILPTLQKSNKQECHYLDIQSSSLTNGSVFLWPCSTAPDRAATVPQCAFPLHPHLLPCPSPSSHKCFNRSGGNPKNPLHWVELRWIVSEFRAPLLLGMKLLPLVSAKAGVSWWIITVADRTEISRKYNDSCYTELFFLA